MFSVIVPVYNDVVRLRKCLTALVNQDFGEDRYEIIVVDNGSDEDVEDCCADEFPGVLFFREEKKGSYAARNHRHPPWPRRVSRLYGRRRLGSA